MNKKKIILIAVAVVAVAGISIRLFGGSTAKHKVTYETATVIKGEISESITATGTIEPVTEVEVGTQVSGIIDKIYADYNSVVTKGQLIAEMDRVTLQSEVASQRAAYNGAKAEYEYQRKNYERNRGLHEKQLISDTDYEQSVFEELGQNFLSNLAARGMTLDTWLPASGLTMEQFIADLHKQANDVARESLALDALARELKIEVTEDDINAEFEKAGVKDVEASKAEFIADGRMPAVRESIRRSKAVDHLVENAKVTEVDETAKDAE